MWTALLSYFIVGIIFVSLATLRDIYLIKRDKKLVLKEMGSNLERAEIQIFGKANAPYSKSKLIYVIIAAIFLDSLVWPWLIKKFIKCLDEGNRMNI